MSSEEAKRKYEEALALMPPELQETFRALAANSRLRPRIESLDYETVNALADEDLEIAVIEFVERKLQASNERREVLLSMSPGFQVFYLSFIVEAEVMNGGFNQFFRNPSSEYAELIAPALRQLGDAEAASIFEQAFAVAISEVDAAAKFQRLGTLVAFSESYQHTRLNEFDSHFFARAEQFPALRRAIVRTNKALFFGSDIRTQASDL